MGQVMEYSKKTNDVLRQDSRTWNGPRREDARHDFATTVLNVRAVEFIARPGKAVELHACLSGRVLEALKIRKGFSGAVILSSHKEARLFTILSFWSTAAEAAENKWEESHLVHQSLFHLIDVCSRVHTYEAVIPAKPVAAGQGKSAFAS